MRLRSLALAACVGLATLAGTAAAQDRSGTFEISPFAGGYFGGRLYGVYTFTAAGPGSGSFVPSTRTFAEPDDDLAYGVRLAYNVNRHFAFEVDWSSARTDVRAPSGVLTFDRPVVGRLRQNVYEANMLFNFGKRRAVGYFGLGAGVASLDLTSTISPQSTSRSRFTANVSAGAKFFFTPRVGIRIDGRYRGIDLTSGDDHSCDRDCWDNWDRGNRWSYNGELTGGLIFAF